MIGYIIVGFIGCGIAYIVGLAEGLNHKQTIKVKDGAEKRNEILEERILFVERKYARKFAECETLKEEYNELLRHYRGNRQSVSIDKDILSAIRKAMIFSHPDKGGNSDEFIKFRQLYDKYK